MKRGVCELTELGKIEAEALDKGLRGEAPCIKYNLQFLIRIKRVKD